jgi:hypothetical protein
MWRDTATADAERARDLAARLERRARAEDEVAAAVVPASGASLDRKKCHGAKRCFRIVAGRIDIASTRRDGNSLTPHLSSAAHFSAASSAW